MFFVQRTLRPNVRKYNCRKQRRRRTSHSHPVSQTQKSDKSMTVRLRVLQTPIARLSIRSTAVDAASPDASQRLRVLRVLC